MSRKLRDFIELLSSPERSRDETDMGSYVSWLRRRIVLLKHMTTNDVIEIIRHAQHKHVDKDEVMFQQARLRESTESSNFYIILRGSVSMFVNPFLSIRKASRGSALSTEQPIFSNSPTLSAVKFLTRPKSSASKRTSVSRMSHTTHAPVKEDDGSDVSDAESDVSIPTDGATVTENLAPEVPNPTAEPSPSSRGSKASSCRTARSKLGKFLVKYEKGKYFGEDDILDEECCFTASIIGDSQTDMIMLDNDNFNTYVKHQHEREVTKLTNFVDIHPFFSGLPLYSKGVIQLSLRPEHYNAGNFIVKQGDPLNQLIFLVSGSAEVIIDPSKHRYQYPNLWPFETSDDVYYKECEWLRESRRRMYSRKYEYKGEISRRVSKSTEQKEKTEISVCAVQNKEVIGVTEVALNLETHIQSLRCLHDCEVFTLNLRPFRRIAKRRNPELMDIVNAYVHMKLQFRIDNTLGEQVPLFRSLLIKVEKEVRQKSYNGMNTKNIQKIKNHEKAVLQMLEWFKMDKSPLLLHHDPDIIKQKEEMKEKAIRREHIRQLVHEKPFFRSGCLATVRPERGPRSLRQLKNPMNELILKLRMEGTFIEDEQELEELLISYSQSPVEEEEENVSSQAGRVLKDQYNLFKYRRHGNRLIRRFVNMLASGNRNLKTPTTLRTLDTATSRTADYSRLSTLPGDYSRLSTLPGNYSRLSTLPEENEMFSRFDRYEQMWTCATTVPSRSSTYRSIQFERRSVTPDTLSEKIKDFHEKYGGTDNEIKSLPRLKKTDLDMQDPEDSPLRGGKVFVTMAPCVSCSKNVLLKNHSHVRCQMLHSLPMDRVKGYETD